MENDKTLTIGMPVHNEAKESQNITIQNQKDYQSLSCPIRKTFWQSIPRSL